MNDTKRYYWLKLKRDFFKRHDVKLIKAQNNGEKYVLFYLTLLAESLDHDGRLRFSDTVPYDEKMLSVITETDIDIVRTAVKMFCELDMMCLLEDGTYYMQKVTEMTGSETSFAEKKRIYRRSKELQIEDKSETKKDIVRQEKEYRVRDRIRNNNKEKFTIPSLEDVSEYCSGRGNRVDPSKFVDHYQSNGWMVGKNKMKDWRAAVRTWERNAFESSPKKVEDLPEAPPEVLARLNGQTHA